MDVARVAETDLWRLPPPAPCRVSGPLARSTTTAGGRLGDRHMAGSRRPLGPATVGVTEDREWDVGRIEEDPNGGSQTFPQFRIRLAFFIS